MEYFKQPPSKFVNIKRKGRQVYCKPLSPKIKDKLMKNLNKTVDNDNNISDPGLFNHTRNSSTSNPYKSRNEMALLREIDEDYIDERPLNKTYTISFK